MPKDLSHIRQALKNAQEGRKKANDLVRYWQKKLNEGRAANRAEKAAREAGVEVDTKVSTP